MDILTFSSYLNLTYFLLKPSVVGELSSKSVTVIMCVYISFRLKFFFCFCCCYGIQEMWSEAIKILKGEYAVRAIKEHKMDQAIIFCRTKIDCDNLEQYFMQQGGGNVSSLEINCVYFLI